uniref:Uncharacterized protein n=1 Tax=Oreochromis aureus TaxID=47969 RepID=A0AAZ1WV32_OREAU
LKQQYVCQRIPHVDMYALIALPPGVDKAEWLASNTLSSFSVFISPGVPSQYLPFKKHQVGILLFPCCVNFSYAFVLRVYVWTDDHGRKLKCSAPLYFDYAMSYIQDLLTDEDVFPTKAGAEFPTGFVFMVQKVFLLLFRTMAHIYWSHYTQAQQVGLHPHLNTLFMHLTLFCRHHGLLDPEDTKPLQDLITALGRQG